MKKEKTPARSIVTACLCFMVFFTGMYGEYQITPVAGEIMQSLGVGQPEYMKLLTFCMFPAIFLSIISGLLCDKFGTKRVVGLFLVLSAVGIVGRIFFTSSYIPLLVCSTLLGLGCMMLTAANAKVLGGCFPPERLGGVIGIVTSASTIGMFLAQSTTALLPSVKTAFVISGVLSVVVAAGWFILIKEPKAPAGASAPAAAPIGESLRTCVKSGSLWLAGLALCCIMAAQVLLTGNLPQALVGRGFTAAAAGTVSSMYMLGCIAGSIAGPLLFFRLRSGAAKRVFLTLAALIIGVGAAFAWSISSTVLMCIALAVTGACVSTIIPVFFAMPISLPEIGPRYAATAGGFQATVQILGATLVPNFVITPLCGTDLAATFMAAGICGALSLVFMNLTPVVRSR